MANILFLYNATQTYTQTLYEYLIAFRQFSEHNYYFAHVSETTRCDLSLEKFDALAIHYSIRLPFDQISPSWQNKIEGFSGQKFLFIQDEYDYTKRSWHWINRLGITDVFTCVPESNIDRIYPSCELPNVNFFNVLTGYVPQQLPNIANLVPPSERKVLVGYRGRGLPARYGRLGQDKLNIGVMVKKYAIKNQHAVDIDWRENKRIYGTKWYDFIASTRATLGTESGSNVFDWDGDIQEKLKNAQAKNPGIEEYDILTDLLGISDEDGLMNQVSPRVFEAISLRTALVLFKGEYSGVLVPDVHYIVLEKDGSNLNSVFELLQDGAKMDEITERVYQDIIESGQYSYQKFVHFVDNSIQIDKVGVPIDELQTGVDALPLQYEIKFPTAFGNIKKLIIVCAVKSAKFIPSPIYRTMKPFVRRVLGV